MNGRELNFQNNSNSKRQKTNRIFTTKINNSIPNMVKTPTSENIWFSLEHNNITSSTSESIKIRGDLTIEKPNVNNDVGVFTANFNTESEQMSTEESDHHERGAVSLVSGPKHIDELPVELLIDAFDYLPLRDLCAIRQTSKKWRQLAGYCFQLNYSRTLVHCRTTENVHAFTQVIRRISIHQTYQLKIFLDKKPNFQQLKSITFSGINLIDMRIDCVKDIFIHVEHLEMCWCNSDEHFTNHIFALTKNLKRLTLCQKEIGNE